MFLYRRFSKVFLFFVSSQFDDVFLRLDEIDSTEPDDSESEVLLSKSIETKTTEEKFLDETLSNEVAKSMEKYFINEKFLIVGDKLGELNEDQCELSS